MKTFSNSVRNPARAGKPFNAQSKFVPRDVSQETKEGKAKRDDGHDAWLNFVRGKLEQLEEC